MANVFKERFLEQLKEKTGAIVKLPRSNSLYDVAGGAARIYIRYSKVHDRGVTFYGLRKEDIQQLAGFPSYLVFLWDTQTEPLFVPFSAYEEVFQMVLPAPDGQYKVQISVDAETLELYLSRVGKFNLEGLSGWSQLPVIVGKPGSMVIPELSHSQVQSVLSAIGSVKGYDVWVPQNDRAKLQHDLTSGVTYRDVFPDVFSRVADILREVDVLWLGKGSNKLCGVFEVEHTTPIYSALLRFNDVHLATNDLSQGYRIVANDERRSLFVRQLNRPTFQASGLAQQCTFLEYRNVYGWFTRVCGKTIPLPNEYPVTHTT